MPLTSNYINETLNISYNQFIEIIKKMSFQMKLEVESVLEKEIEKKRKLPKGVEPAKRNGSYTAMFGLWSDMNLSADQYRESMSN